MIDVIAGDSAESARHIADGSLAFVFIDAGHSYENVCADIKAWCPKIKPGGIIAGHDADHEPVAKAVQDTLGNVATMGTVWMKKL